MRNKATLGRALTGLAASIAAVALVTGVIFAARDYVPVLSLGVLYVFAVLPIAVRFGVLYAVGVSLASMLAFNFFFLAPVHTLSLRESANWFALAVYLVTAVVTSELAARARRRAHEAEQRERETALVADIATALLRGRQVHEELERIAARAAEVLGVSHVRLELGPGRSPPAGESPHELAVDGRRVGTLHTKEGEEPDLAVQRRFLPALASLLAVADERERLAREALEADALRRSDAVKTAVLRAVSHDLRSPLTAISAAVDGLQSPALALDEHDRALLLETIRVETARLDRLVANLLDLSRLQAGAAQPSPEIWSVDELVARAVDELGDEQVVVVLEPEAPPVLVDALQIERVLVNLLENAVKFSPPGEPVTVRVSVTRKEVIVRVVDHGPGVAEDELERIFEPFHRAAYGGRGAGLGLAIARGFAEANGARVWAESRPGQGASFALALPAVEAPVEAPA